MTGNPDPVLAGLLTGARWFAGKHAELVGAERVRTLFAAEGAAVELVAAISSDGAREEYAIPIRGERECDGSDPLWPALARAAGVESRGAKGFLADDLSNTVVVLEGGAVLKLYRRPEPGPHPEPVALEALAGTVHAPALLGQLSEGETTLLVVQELVAGEPVGWESLIRRLADGDSAAGDAGALAETVAIVHRALADALGRTELSLELVSRSPTGPLAELTSRIAAALAGRRMVVAQRIHGDLHVGQFLRSADGLVIVDWEGEPDKPLGERGRPRPAAHDLGSLRLSLAHAARAAHRRNEGFDWKAWSTAARAEALAAYEVVAGPVDRDLLHALEIAKELDELDYAERYLPEWLYAPTAVLPFILEEGS